MRRVGKVRRGVVSEEHEEGEEGEEREKGEDEERCG